MGKIYLGCVLIAALLLAVPVASFVYLRPGTALLVTVAYVALMPLLVKLVLRGVVGASRRLGRHALEMTRQQDELMSAAAVTVHRFEEVSKPPAEKIKDGQPLDKEDEPHRYMLLDCTIAPPMNEGDTWEPVFLGLQQDDPAFEKPEVEGGSVDLLPDGKIHASRLWYAILDTEERELEVPEMLETAARLRLLFACPARMKGAVGLRYLHTTLCELNLPQ